MSRRGRSLNRWMIYLGLLAVVAAAAYGLRNSGASLPTMQMTTTLPEARMEIDETLWQRTFPELGFANAEINAACPELIACPSDDNPGRVMAESLDWSPRAIDRGAMLCFSATPAANTGGNFLTTLQFLVRGQDSEEEPTILSVQVGLLTGVMRTTGEYPSLRSVARFAGGRLCLAAIADQPVVLETIRIYPAVGAGTVGRIDISELTYYEANV